MARVSLVNIIKKLLKLALLGSVLMVITLVIAYYSVKTDLPSAESLRTIKLQTPMQIYTHDGKLISQFGQKKRIPLTIKEMPELMIQAILATEDNRFYQHFGVDPIGMSRAVIGQIMGQNKGGGSTITMQVARNFFLTREQTYIRKLKEIFISLDIERLLTKDEILSLYLNKIELGHRAFGVGAAAQVYYGKDLNDLTLAQIAVIAGLPKAPSTLNPISRPERAKARRTVVLQRMLVSGYITQKQYTEANNAEMTGKRHGTEIEVNAPYIAEMAHQQVLEMYGSEIAYNSGFKVFTTPSSKLQKAAQSAVIENSHNYDERHGYRGVLKSLWQPLATSEDEQDTEQLPVVIDKLGVFENEMVVENNKDTELAAEPITDETLFHADWTYARIKSELDPLPTLEQLRPAVVTAVYEQHVDIIVKGGEISTIQWPNLSWARSFVDDEHQGPAPKTAIEIVAEGNLIWIRPGKDGSHRLSQVPQASAALVSLSPDTGAIQSAVGGYSFEQSQFNRVTQAKRQVGSNIKPFIYSAALDNGFTLSSIINDAPINQWDRRSGFVWRPKNSPPKYDGPIRIRNALAQSKNVVSVRLLRAVGLDKVRFHLASFGFDHSELPKNESLALGAASLTPLEVATGVAAFANGGFLVEPYFIDRIEDSTGNIIYKANPTIACDDCDKNTIDFSEEGELIESDNSNIRKAERVISKQNAFLITQAMNSAIWGSGGSWKNGTGWNGTGHRARGLKRRDIAGKTGTTNESKDAWFSGFSRRIVTTSWIGFDDHKRNLGKTSSNRNLGKGQTFGGESGAKSAQTSMD